MGTAMSCGETTSTWRRGDIRQGIDFISAADSQRAAAVQEKRNVRAKAGGDFQQARGFDALSRSGAEDP